MRNAFPECVWGKMIPYICQSRVVFSAGNSHSCSTRHSSCGYWRGSICPLNVQLRLKANARTSCRWKTFLAVWPSGSAVVPFFLADSIRDSPRLAAKPVALSQMLMHTHTHTRTHTHTHLHQIIGRKEAESSRTFHTQQQQPFEDLVVPERERENAMS